MTLQREQIQLGTNVYGDHTTDPAEGLTGSIHPEFSRRFVHHEPANSVVQPQKDLGPVAPVIRGTMLFYETSVPDFVADVGDDSADRKLYWMDCGTEVYAWVRAGVTSRERWGDGWSAYFQLVTFEFTSLRTAVYRSADDSIWMGG